MSYKNAARAAALLLTLVLFGSACGKKGPLYLPDAHNSAPAVALVKAGSAAGRTSP